MSVIAIGSLATCSSVGVDAAARSVTDATSARCEVVAENDRFQQPAPK
jgi:hypothetical protein